MPTSFEIQCPQCDTPLKASAQPGTFKIHCVACSGGFFVKVTKNTWKHKKRDRGYSAKVVDVAPPPVQATTNAAPSAAATPVYETIFAEADFATPATPLQQAPSYVPPSTVDKPDGGSSWLAPILIGLVVVLVAAIIVVLASHDARRRAEIAHEADQIPTSYPTAPKRPFWDVEEIPVGPEAVTIHLDGIIGPRLNPLLLDLCENVGASGYRLQRNPARSTTEIRVRYGGPPQNVADEIQFADVVSVDEEKRMVRIKAKP